MTNIEWSDDQNNNNNPWQKRRGAEPFRDLILKQEFRSRRLRFEIGQTWLRLVPALASSPYGWMLGVHALSIPGVLFTHPRTLKQNAQSLFDLAYAWLKENEPGALFSKTHRQGLRLLPDPTCLFWAFMEANGRYTAQLVQASGYDGSRGGVPGLGHQVLELTRRRDENNKLMAEPVHPQRGVLIAVTKAKAPGTKYPTYALTVGRQPAPMEAVIERMDPAELDVLCPLEEVVHQVSNDEEWEFLAKVLTPKQLNGLRESLAKA